MYEQDYTKKLVCLKCGGLEWTEIRCWNMSGKPGEIIPVHEYRCNSCGFLMNVKNDPFQAPTSRQVLLEKGDEVIQ